MYGQGGDGRGDVIIDPITGEVVNRLTGEVIGQLVEGVDYPARPRAGNTGAMASVKSRGGLNTLARIRPSMVIGVRDYFQERARAVRELADKIEEVMVRRGVRVHRAQAEALAERLMGLGRPSRYLNVLDCLLDPGCIKYGPGDRAPVRRAFEDVFGPGSLVKAQIMAVLREWHADGVLGVNEVYQAYDRVSRMARIARKSYTARTKIELAITYLILINEGEEEARKYLSLVGKEELLNKLRELITGT